MLGVRMRRSHILLAAAAVAPRALAEQSFTINNGQIFTPGFVVVDAPQPGTPLGGDTLHLALDVTASGKLPLEVDSDSPSRIHAIDIFLYSYDTGRNFTVTNGTASEGNASLGDILEQESGSTVKHVNWVWPECLVGNGEPSGSDSDRGTYNISIHQNFRLNDEDHYTIFDLPIAVTNSIEESSNRTACDLLNNELIDPEDVYMGDTDDVGVLFAPDDSTDVQYEDGDDDDGENDDGENDDGENGDGEDDDGESGDGDNDDDDGDEPNFGGQRPEAGPEDGLGAGSTLDMGWGVLLSCIALAAVGI